MPRFTIDRRGPTLALALALTLAAVPALAGGFTYVSGERGLRYALLEGDRSTVGSTHSDDWREIQELQQEYAGVQLWFEHEGRSYVLRDAERVEEAREILRPMMLLGRKQGELGRRQGALGAEQGRLGARQGQLGARQGRLGAQIGALNARIAARERRGDSTRELRRELRAIEREMSELGRRQSELGREQSELGERQSDLGRIQSELGEEQARVSRVAEKELRELVADAVRDGSAKRID